MFMENFGIPIEMPKAKAKYKNMLEFQGMYRKLVNMALNIFKWNNLPETCNEWVLEYSLLMYGKACIMKDDIRGLLSLPCQESNMFSIYGYTSDIIAYGFNGYTKQVPCYMPNSGNEDTAQAVMLYDNPSRYPYSRYIIEYAQRLADCVRSIDVAVKKLKNPYWIVCTNTQVPTVKKSLSDIDNNENAIITASNLSPDDFKILPTSTNPNILNGLWDNYNNYYDVVKELLGINNNEQSDKKERLITDEVNSNNYVTDLFLQFRLKQRQDFCENVNKIFGTNISVELSSTFQAFEETLTSEDDEDDEGVDDNAE